MDTTKEIHAILYMQFPEQLNEILLQPNPEAELKRFVTYVFDRTGSFGSINHKSQLEHVDWHKIISGEYNSASL